MNEYNKSNVIFYTLIICAGIKMCTTQKAYGSRITIKVTKSSTLHSYDFAIGPQHAHNRITKRDTKHISRHNVEPVGLPFHNFWPWIPMFGNMESSTHGNMSAELYAFGTDVPLHSFWPFVPVYDPVAADSWKTDTKSLPEHSFWPFVPILNPDTPRSRSTIWPPTRPPRREKITPPTQQPKLSTPSLPWPPSLHRSNYGEVLYKSILFFEVQRSGRLPHNRKVRWRGDSALGDRGDNGEDLSGGWYDSGDYVKFGLPMAAATSLLLYGLIEFPDAYSALGLLDDVRDSVKWPLDFFIKAHPDKFVFYGQVGDPYLDHAYWGRPEEMDMERPAYKLTPDLPGSDLVAETSAAMAAGYVAFRNVDPGYAQNLLTHAQDLFEFAERFRGVYSDSIPNAAEFYKSENDEDELAWAALWLYRATGRRAYLSRAIHWLRRAPPCWAQSWADKTCSSTVLLYQLTGDPGVKSTVEKMFASWLPGGTIQYTPRGLAFRSNWGTLRYTANMSFLALVAAQADVNPDLYRRWATSQIHYMLGDAGRSYVIGFGKNPPTKPHHASSSCRPAPYSCTWEDYDKPEANAHILYGALVGGPDLDDNFVDSREDYVHNEVGCDYNGGFQSAIAALQHLELSRI